jgi:glycosyltransferase involved in cell wall biosynthesis
MKKITHIQRKSRQKGNFSLEIHYAKIRENLSKNYDIKLLYLPFQSDGVLKKILNIFYVFLKRGEINHVTGDVTYVAIALIGKKNIITILDLITLKTRNRFKKYIFTKLWYEIPIKYSRTTTAISEAITTELCEMFPYFKEKIVRVYFSGNTDLIRFDKQFNNICPVILQLGTAYNKNIPRILEALKDYRCNFIIVGNPEFLVDEYVTDKLKIDVIDRALSNSQVKQLYHSCDIVSFASTYEGFGMPIIEANLVGRIVVTSNIGAMKEVADNSAILVDPFDIQSIKNGFEIARDDNCQRHIYIQNGFVNALRFNIDYIANCYSDLYCK